VAALTAGAAINATVMNDDGAGTAGLGTKGRFVARMTLVPARS
jgi:hypothetical protein